MMFIFFSTWAGHVWVEKPTKRPLPEDACSQKAYITSDIEIMSN